MAIKHRQTINRSAATGLLLTGFVFGAGLFLLLGFGEDDRRQQNAAANQAEAGKWRLPAAPQQIDFAGEKVPVERWDVKEQLEREILVNYYMPANILYLQRLSGRYFPLIEAQLKANDIPDDFKYLCVAESNLQNLVSKAQATGFWQFMKGTAPGYALEVNENVDERYHVEKSTAAACKYLRMAYQRFGNWTAAAAAYNCGMGGYGSRASFQGTNYYYDLVLPEETQRYIFRILAFKYLLVNADSLGFSLANGERFTPVKTRTVTVNRSVPNLHLFAKEQGTNYKMIKLLNPWLRGRSLPAAYGKEYKILMPDSSAIR